jgi:hypothetical protein
MTQSEQDIQRLYERMIELDKNTELKNIVDGWFRVCRKFFGKFSARLIKKPIFYAIICRSISLPKFHNL